MPHEDKRGPVMDYGTVPKEPTPTPRPWTVTRRSNKIVTGGGTHPAVNGWVLPCSLYERDPEEAEANAERIVRAVNREAAAEECVEALRSFDRVLVAAEGASIEYRVAKELSQALAVARAALARWEGK